MHRPLCRGDAMHRPLCRGEAMPRPVLTGRKQTQASVKTKHMQCVITQAGDAWRRPYKDSRLALAAVHMKCASIPRAISLKP